MADTKTFQELMQAHRYMDAVALGFVAGVEPDVKFGHIPDAAADTATDVWENGALQPLYLFPSDAGDSIEMFSAATDTQNITIEGLDASGVFQTETLALSGTATETGAVAIPGTWRAVNRAFNDSGIDLTGAVTIRKVGDSLRVYAFISISDQQTSQSTFVVPVGKVALINNYSNAINKTGGATISGIFVFRIRKPGKVFRTQIRYGLQREGTSNISSDLIVPVLAGPLSQLKITATPSFGPTDISSEYSMWLVDKELIPSALLAAIS